MNQNVKLFCCLTSAAFGGLIVFLVVAATVWRAQIESNAPITGELPLEQARGLHPTHLDYHGPAPQQFDNTPPRGIQEVRYLSQGRMLLAWIAYPDGPGPHPAILYCHGGFALGEGDFQDALPFVEAGYIVMMPAYRGENGNAGDFERCFGEVDDANAALDYLSKIPGADSTRLYACGHSMGGTMAMLLAEISPRLRAAASCGAFPDIHSVAIDYRLLPESREFPFDTLNPYEDDLRSPARFVGNMKCPFLIFYGSRERLYGSQSQRMATQGRALGKNISAEAIPNADHYQALGPAVQKMIVFFQDH